VTAAHGEVAGGVERADRLTFLADAVAASAAVAAAGRLGVLARLEAGPAGTAALAADCGIGERGAKRLLAALAGLGLIERDEREDGAWRAAIPGLSRLGGLHAMWDALPDVVRSGRPVAPIGSPDGAAAFYPGVVGFIAAMFVAAAERAATLMPAGARVLDAGAGAAPWSLAVAARNPGCHVTAVDLGEVLPVTTRAVTAAGLTDRYRYQAADLFTANLGGPTYHLVIIANVCHLFSARENRRLIGKLAGCLRPDRALAVVDVLSEGCADPGQVARYELGLMLRSGQGQVYPLAAYEDWLTGAGLGQVERHFLLDQSPLALMLAHAPGYGAGRGGRAPRRGRRWRARPAGRCPMSRPAVSWTGM
jgi:hypothetical protein